MLDFELKTGNVLMDQATKYAGKLATLGLIASLFCVPCTTYAQSAEEVPEASRELIKELIRVSGGEKIGQLMSEYFVQSITQAISQRDPGTDPRVFTILEEEVNAIIAEEMIENEVMVDLNAPIYIKYLTDEDLQNTLDFYKTETGKKFIEVMPLITQESMQAGNAWGAALAPKIQERVDKRLKEEGLEMPK